MPAFVAAERAFRERNRRENSRQRRRRRVFEAVHSKDGEISFDALCQRIVGDEDSSAAVAVDDFMDGWDIHAPRLLTYAAATQTELDQKDQECSTQPEVWEAATQVGGGYSVGPEYPPGQISFWQIGLYIRNHPDLNSSELTQRLILDSADPKMAGPDRRRLYGYVCAAIAAEQTLVDGILQSMETAVARDPSGRQAIVEAKAIVADRAIRPVSRFVMNHMAEPPFGETVNEDLFL